LPSSYVSGMMSVGTAGSRQRRGSRARSTGSLSSRAPEEAPLGLCASSGARYSRDPRPYPGLNPRSEAFRRVKSAKNRPQRADRARSTGLRGKYTGLPGKPYRLRRSGYRASEEIYRASGEESPSPQRHRARSLKPLLTGLFSERSCTRQSRPLTSPSGYFAPHFRGVSAK
jgi:hypothetical protein